MKRTHSTMTAAELEAWRGRHGLTKDAAAAKLGISPRQMYHYLSGRHPISESVAKLCEALDLVENLQKQLI
jgi:transcriptional regulator with XRE-family HTH domain